MASPHQNRVDSHLHRYFIEIEKKYAIEFPEKSASNEFLTSLDAMAVACRDELEKCETSVQMLKVIRGHYTRFAVGCKNDKRVQPRSDVATKEPSA